MKVKCPKCEFSQETALLPLSLKDKHLREDNIFNFCFNEETQKYYCDIFDWGIHRVWRDEAKKIIRIDMIRNGVLVSLKEEKE